MEGGWACEAKKNSGSLSPLPSFFFSGWLSVERAGALQSAALLAESFVSTLSTASPKAITQDQVKAPTEVA